MSFRSRVGPGCLVCSLLCAVWCPRPIRGQLQTPVEHVIAGPGLDIDVAATGDGQLVYASSRNGHLEIWRRAVAGGALFQLTSSVGGSVDRYPSVRRDGGAVLFQSDRGSGIRNIWSLTTDGGRLAQITSFSDGGASHPALSPKGDELCFTRTSATGDVSIWVMGVDGRQPREVSDGVDCSWTPDARIVFARGDDRDRPTRFDIWRIEADGSGAALIAGERQTWSRNPVVSPDGRWLVYTSYPRLFAGDIRDVGGGFQIDPALRTTIWQKALGSSDPANELVSGDGFNSYPAWSTDSSTVYFTSTRSGSADIWAVRAPR